MKLKNMLSFSLAVIITLLGSNAIALNDVTLANSQVPMDQLHKRELTKPYKLSCIIFLTNLQFSLQYRCRNNNFKDGSLCDTQQSKKRS